MKRLFHGDPPKRLFTFGSSYTEYDWATWANILGFELKLKYDCQFYNFGKGGAGNTYISNLISQTDQYYNFNENDLVIVCWTSIIFEDRWKDGEWHCEGNVYSTYLDNPVFDYKTRKCLIDHTHFLMRDLANIKLVDNLLQSKTRYHFLSTEKLYNDTLFSSQDYHYKILIKNYKNVLEKISPGYMDVLWNNDIGRKISYDSKSLHKYYIDHHPSPIEHFYYLLKTFEYEFSSETKSVIKKTNEAYKNLILEVYHDIKKRTHPLRLPKIDKIKYYSGCKKLLICDPEEIDFTIFVY